MAVAADHVGHRCAPGFMRIKKKRLAVNPLMLNDLARNQNRILLIFLQRLPSQALHFIAGHFPPAPFNDFLGAADISSRACIAGPSMAALPAAPDFKTPLHDLPAAE